MPFYIPIFSNVSTIDAGGKYRIWFRNVKDFSQIQTGIFPRDYALPNEVYNLRVYEVNKFVPEKKVNMIIELIPKQSNQGKTIMSLQKSPLVAPAVLIVGGIIAVLGLSLLNMTFDKVEKLLENPVLETVVVVGLIFAVYIFIRQIRKG